MIVDFHTHAFPDALAERAMATLLAETTGVTAHLDGRLASLLASMDRAGIATAVLCSIATRPEQFDKIVAWSRQIASDRIVPLPSVHPSDPKACERVRRVAEEGFKGIKLHPYYQDFILDEPRVWPLYRTLEETGLLLVCHTGFDIAFPRIRRCDPVRIANVVKMFPGLRLVATHLGAWSDWDEVRRVLIGLPLSMELSYSLGELPAAQARELLMAHPADRLLFGSDSPWQDQAETLARLRALDLGAGREAAILGGNARRLLGGGRGA